MMKMMKAMFSAQEGSPLANKSRGQVHRCASREALMKRKSLLFAAAFLLLMIAACLLANVGCSNGAAISGMIGGAALGVDAQGDLDRRSSGRSLHLP
jgi:membrane associated rhomboid family serine protease